MSKSTDPFRYFDSSPEVIRLVGIKYVHYPLSLRNVMGWRKVRVGPSPSNGDEFALN
jgi:hypothetical protein